MPSEFTLGEIETTAEEMRSIASVGLRAVKARINRAQDEFDLPMLPLAKGYQKRKTRRGRRGVRDFVFSGVTIGTMQVVEATAHESVIGFTQPLGEKRMKIRINLGDRAFGLSPTDMQAIDAELPGLLDAVARRVIQG